MGFIKMIHNVAFKETRRRLAAGILAFGVTACAMPGPKPEQISSTTLPMVHPRLEAVSADSATIQQPRNHEGRPVVFQLGMRIPQQPAGVVLVVPGGDGLGKWQSQAPDGGLAPPYDQTFDNRILVPLAVHGLVAAVMTSPADGRGPAGLNANAGFGGTFRQSAAHADDIAAAADYLRMRFRKPVWVLGWAEAGVSVVNAAVLRPDAFAGLILAAPWTGPLGSGLARWRYSHGVLSLPVDRIRQPVLIVSHQRDTCPDSAPDGPGRLHRRLTLSAAVVSATYAKAPPAAAGCGPASAHAFAGLESRLAAAIAGFVQRYTQPAGKRKEK